MRLRNIKGAKKKLRDHPDDVVSDPSSKQGKWQDVFGNNHPIHLEIGCGKGQFIVAMANDHPEVNFLALEKYDSVLLRVLEKQLEETLPNLKLIRVDARHIRSFFSDGEIDGVYLNFSDPWPKHRHAKRRLTHMGYLKRYREIIKNGGFIRQRTDQFSLFEFSIDQFIRCPWLEIEALSLDLHRDKDINHTTEFEDKFIQEGKRIFYAALTVIKGVKSHEKNL